MKGDIIGGSNDPQEVLDEAFEEEMMDLEHKPSIKNLYSNYEKLRPLITLQRFKDMESKARI